MVTQAYTTDAPLNAMTYHLLCPTALCYLQKKLLYFFYPFQAVISTSKLHSCIIDRSRFFQYSTAEHLYENRT